MSSHDASAQMLGYLFQVRYALAMLLSADNEQSSICIEKFDDIAFSDDYESPNVLIQTKHHINSRGDLTDSSVDLWRTLKVWIDAVQHDKISNVKFVIVTTANAPDGSASSFLRVNERNVAYAYSLLKATAENSTSKTNKKYYQAFLEVSSDSMQAILDEVTIIDLSVNILNVLDGIKKSIRYSSRPEFEDKVLQRIEGWWFKKSIEALCSTLPVFISQGQVRSIINDISSEYAPDNLPIDTDFIDDIDIANFPTKERLFCEQLRLISVKSKRMNLAIRDYYRAFAQRNNWIKDDLLYIDELERYEERLVDEWQHLFARMQDEVDENNEKEKQKAGRALLGSVEDKDIRIRTQCSDGFIMRGSYHMLANQLRVGWHLDFINRLAMLLHGEG